MDRQDDVGITNVEANEFASLNLLISARLFIKNSSKINFQPLSITLFVLEEIGQVNLHSFQLLKIMCSNSEPCEPVFLLG